MTLPDCDTGFEQITAHNKLANERSGWSAKLWLIVTHMAPDEVATQSITDILVNFVNSPGLQTLQTNIHLKSVNIKNVSSFEMCK